MRRILLCSGALCGCIISQRHFERRIQLDDENALVLGAGDETDGDEELARALQAAEPEWEA